MLAGEVADVGEFQWIVTGEVDGLAAFPGHEGVGWWSGGRGFRCDGVDEFTVVNGVE